MTPSAFKPLPAITVRRLMALRRWYFHPRFIGAETLDLKRPALFVGNHTLYGLVDVPLMVEHLYTQHGTYLRSLGDRGHFAIPGWRDVLVRSGMVLGTPQNCDALMAAGESILVFPGGAREVWRRKDEQYTLIWKKRVGFVRQAIRHGYDIIPFGALGADECYSILADADDLQTSAPLKHLLQPAAMQAFLRGGDMIPPIARGLGLTPLPRPQRLYFGFGARIPTSPYTGRENDDAVLWSVRDEVADAVGQQLSALKDIRRRERTESWSWLRRKLAPESGA